MNFKDAARNAASKALMAHGLTENMAVRIVSRMVGFQSDEWTRILERVRKGEVKNLYVLVAHFDSTNFGTFLYAPIEVNNIAVLTKWLSSDMGAGCWVDSPVDEEEEASLEPGTYSVSMFDIANEMNRWMRDVQRTACS